MNKLTRIWFALFAAATVVVIVWMCIKSTAKADTGTNSDQTPFMRDYWEAERMASMVETLTNKPIVLSSFSQKPWLVITNIGRDSVYTDSWRTWTNTVIHVLHEPLVKKVGAEWEIRFK